MVMKKARQNFSKEEIIEILKRNVNMFRDEEEFVQYIFDLAMYLVEHRLRTMGGNDVPQPEALPTQLSSIVRRDDQFQRTRERDEELYKVLRKHATRADGDVYCRMCGAPTGGRGVCPNCGGMP
jgi:hypothetical protein